MTNENPSLVERVSNTHQVGMVFDGFHEIYRAPGFEGSQADYVRFEELVRITDFGQLPGYHQGIEISDSPLSVDRQAYPEGISLLQSWDPYDPDRHQRENREQLEREKPDRQRELRQQRRKERRMRRDPEYRERVEREEKEAEERSREADERAWNDLYNEFETIRR